MNLTILSLNIRGMVDKDRARRLKSWMQEDGLEPDIICLQEVKEVDNQLRERLDIIDKGMS